MSRGRHLLLLAAFGVGWAAALVLGLDELAGFARGERDAGHVAAVVAVAWLSLLPAAVVMARPADTRVARLRDAERALAGAKRRVADVVASRSVDIALQPVVDLGTGRPVGVEALARFRDGRGPDGWFRDARDTGQVVELERITFQSALELLPQLPESCYLSINASPQLLTEGSLVRRMANGDLPLDRIVIEITEHVQIESYEELRLALAQLRERGVRLAIDDTGAGYASFNHVLQLRPDIIKIDRSLVANVTGDAARRSLVTALVLLALDLDATVTAEGIETPAELETLASLGVDCAQGHLLARPSTDPDVWRRWSHRNWLAGRPVVLPELGAGRELANQIGG